MTQEQDIAKRIVHLLDDNAARVDGAAFERLSAARRQAVAAAVARARAAPLAAAGVGHFLLEYLHGRRAWMVLLVTAVLVSLAVQQITHHAPVVEDALLLASDLPPEAYLDKGFDAWLERSSQY